MFSLTEFLFPWHFCCHLGNYVLSIFLYILHASGFLVNLVEIITKLFRKAHKYEHLKCKYIFQNCIKTRTACMSTSHFIHDFFSPTSCTLLVRNHMGDSGEKKKARFVIFLKTPSDMKKSLQILDLQIEMLQSIIMLHGFNVQRIGYIP